MKLIFDGSIAVYHPATGLDLTSGEQDYPDDKAEQLIAAGLKPARAMPPKRLKAAEE